MSLFPDDLLKAFNMDISSISSAYGWLKSEGFVFVLLIIGSYSGIMGSNILLKEENDKTIEYLNSVLSDENILKGVMKDELRQIKKDFGTPRRTIIKDEITEIKIDELSMIPKEDYIVSVSKSGYIKKVSIKSYNASKDTPYGIKEGANLL